MKAREVMTTDVISVQEDTQIEEVARVMARYRISGVPVVNQAGAVVGLVTEYDLITKQGQSIGDIMARSVVSVSPDTEVEEIAHLLANRRIRRVPVMEGDRLVGILSRSDLVKQIAMRWVCHTCGEMVQSAAMPERCPRCGAPQSAFASHVEPPGM